MSQSSFSRYDHDIERVMNLFDFRSKTVDDAVLSSEEYKLRGDQDLPNILDIFLLVVRYTESYLKSVFMGEGIRKVRYQLDGSWVTYDVIKEHYGEEVPDDLVETAWWQSLDHMIRNLDFTDEQKRYLHIIRDLRNKRTHEPYHINRCEPSVSEIIGNLLGIIRSLVE